MMAANYANYANDHSSNWRNSRPIIALDFDGVICDSINECMLVSFTAYDGRQTVPRSFVEYFQKYRYLVRPPGEYLVIVEAYHRDIELTQSKFHELAAELPLSQFEPRFFATRERIRAADFQAWLNLHRMYPQFSDAWPLPVMPYVVTTRDLDSLKYLLHAFGINIPAENLRSTKSKPDAIRSIAPDPSQIVFVDDHPGHLADVAKTGARVLWADWGYWPARNVPYDRISSIREISFA